MQFSSHMSDEPKMSLKIEILLYPVDTANF